MPRIDYKNYIRQYNNITQAGAKNGDYPCFYCGVPSNSVDHFVPQSYLSIIRMFLDTTPEGNEKVKNVYEKTILSQELIPACRDCNSRASDGVFDTPDDKKSFVKAKLRKKFERILELPYWSDGDIKELDYELQQTVLGAISQKNHIEKRLKW